MKEIVHFSIETLLLLAHLLINTDTASAGNSNSSPWWQVAVAVSIMVVLWFMLPNHKNLKKSS